MRETAVPNQTSNKQSQNANKSKRDFDTFLVSLNNLDIEEN